ncbi:hypothetical protein AGMMS49992_10940 [Clostridia bacterium]|nr:hypothetical protein AGMMS49992_10940 [Clostridia bacterium]
MLNRISFRMRMLVSCIAIIIPIALITAFTYTTQMDASVRNVDQSTIDKLTYAMIGMRYTLGRFDSLAQNEYDLSRAVAARENTITVTNETQMLNALAAIAERTNPSASVLFYLEGDRYLFTNTGKFLYSDYERLISDRLNLSMSSFFNKLLSDNKFRLTLLQDGQQNPVATAYMVPMMQDERGANLATIAYVVDRDTLQAELENYLGNFTGDLMIYDSKNALVHASYQGEDQMVPLSYLLKVKGFGKVDIQFEGHPYVLLRVIDAERGITYAVVAERKAFYAPLDTARSRMLAIIIAINGMLVLLSVWLSFFNSIPIQKLALEMMGNRAGGQRPGNELTLIKESYEATREKNEELESRYNSILPLMAQQFLRRLVLGGIATREEFDTLCRLSDIHFARTYNIAFYLPMPSGAMDDAGQHERLQLHLNRLSLAQASAATVDIPTENALCMAVNFNASPDMMADTCHQMSLALRAALIASEFSGIPIGVGGAYEDPMRLSDSFAEACAAVQLAEQGCDTISVFQSCEPASASEDTMFTGISAISRLLLIEGIHRGDSGVALRALHGIIDGMCGIAESLLMFRFYTAELLNILIQQAQEMRMPIDAKQLKQTLAFNSQAEFRNKAAALTHELCEQAKAMQRKNESAMNDRVMGYILDNYKRFDLNIQTVSDGLDIRKVQIAAIVKENTGQNFAQYVSYLRMNEFKRLLVETERTIAELVTDIGYGDVSNFLRKFKAVEGVTAGQYRAMHGGEKG